MLLMPQDLAGNLSYGHCHTTVATLNAAPRLWSTPLQRLRLHIKIVLLPSGPRPSSRPPSTYPSASCLLQTYPTALPSDIRSVFITLSKLSMWQSLHNSTPWQGRIPPYGLSTQSGGDHRAQAGAPHATGVYTLSRLSEIPGPLRTGPTSH